MIERDWKAFNIIDTHLFQSTPLTHNQNIALNSPALFPTRVLVVDDDRDTSELLKIILEPNSFEVTIANSGEDGIDLARRFDPDVMIVDLNMPDMDGLRVCQAVRQFSNTPILVLSAVNKKNIVSEALNCGADDFLVKPMVSSLLIASVNKLARRARAEQKAQEANGSSTDQS